jgi:hypothetical protein
VFEDGEDEMGRTRILIAACAMALGVAGVGASSAAAKEKKAKPTLTLEVGGVPLAAGAGYEASSTNFDIHTTEWNLSCPNGVFTGTLGSNGQKKADTAPIAEGNFDGEPLCASPFDFVVFWDPDPTAFSLSLKGKAEIRSPYFRLEPLESVEHPPGSFCQVYVSKMLGTFPVGATPQPLVVTFTDVAAKLGNPRPTYCGKEQPQPRPTISGGFTFSSGGLPIEVVN